MPSALGAAKKPPSPLLWATVNVCDTTAHPDTIGIRGSMPGHGDPNEHMFMRIQLQYYAATDASWHNVGPTGDSGFIAVGSGKYKARQAGRYFTVKPPDSGYYTLRGAVTYEWRVAGDVVKRARRRTTSGHPSTSGADPHGFTAANCILTK